MIAADISDLFDLSNFLGYSSQHIFYLVATSDNQYISIKIPKRDSASDFRSIDIPTTELKGVQRTILRQILQTVPVSEQTYSYVKDRTMLEAAKKMCGGTAILKNDLADFFPSILSKRIFGLFRSLGFNNSVSTILTKLCSYNDKLAQGAPTSPYISNLILRKLDRDLNKLSKSWEAEYVRYSDDIFIIKNKNFNHLDLQNMIINIVHHNGFDINGEKRRYYPKGVPRKTLGLLTHGLEPAIPGPVRRRIRNDFFRASRNVAWGQKNLHFLRGNLEWYKLVYGKDERYVDYNTILNGIQDLRLHFSYQSI